MQKIENCSLHFKKTSALSERGKNNNTTNGKLWQVCKHPCFVLIVLVRSSASDIIVPNLKQVTCNTVLSTKQACKAMVTVPSFFCCRFFFLQVWVGNSWLDDWHLSGKSMDREQVCIIKKRPIRNKGWATPPFEDNWHTRNLHLSRPTGWQASGALPICPPSPSRGLDLSCLGPATKTAPLGEKNSENAERS